MQTKGAKGMKVSLPTLKNQQVSASVSQMAKIMGPPAASANKAKTTNNLATLSARLARA